MAGSVSTITITIQTLTGKTMLCKVNLNAKVARVKEEIFDKMKYEVEKQRLIFNAKELNDSSTLSECNIVENSTLTLVFRLRQKSS